MLSPGALIADKYRVERLLGQGGMGAVYAATNVVLSKTVALKVMSAAFGEDPQATERFFREATTASRVRHPAIVEIYDAGRTADGAPWMAMELLEGESLGQRLERIGRLPLGEVLPIFGPVLAALDAVHAQGIVHRDLKPDNIFLERLPDGRVQPKLLDFGIAKRADGLDKLTRTGSVMGTAHYLAPEQARDSSRVDPRTDLYAIGVVLYESLCGRMPYEAATVPELVVKLLTEDPRPLLAVAPEVPPALANVVHWCMAREVAARPQRSGDLAHHLASALAGVPSSLALPGPSAPPVAGREHTGSADGAAFAAAGLVATRGAPPPSGPPPAPVVAPTVDMASAPGVHAPGPLTPQIGGFSPAPSPGVFSPAPASSPGVFSPAPASGTARGYGYGAPIPPPVSSSPSSGKTSRWLIAGIVGVIVLAGCLTFGLPIGMGVLGMITSLGMARGAGGPFVPTMTFPRRWESWRAPVFVDVNGDGHEDLVGWTAQVIGTDDHELLCAFSGTDGHELWCADVGAQDDLSYTRTALASDRVVYFDAGGAISAFRLSDGESLGWSATAGGRVEEICAVEGGRWMVRTADRLWTELTLASGRAALQGDAGPAACAPPPSLEPPRGLDTRVSAPGWTARRRWGFDEVERPEIDAENAFTSPDGRHELLVGQGRGQARNPPMLGWVEDGTLRWAVVVASDPQIAETVVPEAVAVADDAIFASYPMTARAGVPRRLTALRRSDGSRLWDVALEDAVDRAAWYVLAGREHVVVSANTILLVLDRRTGARRFQLGERVGR